MTPPLESRRTPAPHVWLKREDTHELGAFKWRGALPTLAGYGDGGTRRDRVDRKPRRRDRVGGRGGSGSRAIVFAPREASATKLALIERLGAEIRLRGRRHGRGEGAGHARRGRARPAVLRGRRRAGAVRGLRGDRRRAPRPARRDARGRRRPGRERRAARRDRPRARRAARPRRCGSASSPRRRR